MVRGPGWPNSLKITRKFLVVLISMLTRDQGNDSGLKRNERMSEVSEKAVEHSQSCIQSSSQARGRAVIIV